MLESYKWDGMDGMEISVGTDSELSFINRNRSAAISLKGFHTLTFWGRPSEPSICIFSEFLNFLYLVYFPIIVFLCSSPPEQ